MPDRPLPQKVIEGLTTKSNKIRALADAGYSRTEIASHLHIRYQHVRKVLVDSGRGDLGKVRGTQTSPRKRQTRKPHCARRDLLGAGFQHIGRWSQDGETIVLEGQVPGGAGVYAFAINEAVMYVGVASRSLKQRLNFYRNAGPTQRTNIRLRSLILAELAKGRSVEVLVATPGRSEWNGLPVDLAVGLEGGVIRAFALPWNKR